MVAISECLLEGRTKRAELGVGRKGVVEVKLHVLELLVSNICWTYVYRVKLLLFQGKYVSPNNMIQKRQNHLKNEQINIQSLEPSTNGKYFKVCVSFKIYTR